MIDSNHGWLSALIAQQVLHVVESLGLPLPQLLADAGLSEQDLPNRHNWVPSEHVVRLFMAALRRQQDPLLGLHAARDAQLAAYGVVGHLIQTCGSLGEAIRQISTFQALVSNITHAELHHQPGIALLTLECRHVDDPAFVRHCTEYMLATLVLLGRMVAQRPQDLLLAVHFQHAAPSDKNLITQYQQLFQCPVYFGQPHSALVLPALALEQPLRHPNPHLQETLEQHAREQLAQLELRQTLADQVRYLLRALLKNGGASRERVAAQLGLTGRTLHRHLLRDGQSYQAILDELRFELAQDYLLHDDCTMEEITHRLGFSESQSFIRWFRRLADCPPGEYRRRQLQTA